jgi:hypothetical protein
VSDFINDALRAQLDSASSNRAQQPSATRAVLLVGASGRFGEALLSELAACPTYSRIDVCTVAPIEMGVARLAALPFPRLNPVQDVVLHIASNQEAFGKSVYGRDGAFKTVTEDEAAGWVEKFIQLGVQRLAMVKATSAFSQMGGVGNALAAPYELAAHQSAIETTLIFRPTPIVEATPSAAGGFFAKVLQGYFSLNRFSMPKSFEPLRTQDAAAVIVQTLVDSLPGLSILTADQMRIKLEAIKTSRNPS